MSHPADATSTRTFDPLAGLCSLLACLLLTVAACSGPQVDVRAEQSFDDYSGTRTIEASVPAEEVDELTLAVTLRVDQGEVDYRVIDPRGMERWSGSTSGKIEDERSFTPIVGEWRLELDFAVASGEYEVVWSGG
jgi:hypothetical protein